MKYKVGDKVRVRADLKVGVRYGDNTFVSIMLPFAGKGVTIDIIDNGQYRIKEAGCRWTDEMFSGLADGDNPDGKYQVGDVVEIVKERTSVMNCDGEADHWLGKQMTIKSLQGSGYSMEEDQGEVSGSGWYWTNKEIARLVRRAGEQKELKPEDEELNSDFFTGRVTCVSIKNLYLPLPFVAGETYEIKNGRFKSIDLMGLRFPRTENDRLTAFGAEFVKEVA